MACLRARRGGIGSWTCLRGMLEFLGSVFECSMMSGKVDVLERQESVLENVLVLVDTLFDYCKLEDVVK